MVNGWDTYQTVCMGTVSNELCFGAGMKESESMRYEQVAAATQSLCNITGARRAMNLIRMPMCCDVGKYIEDLDYMLRRPDHFKLVRTTIWNLS